MERKESFTSPMPRLALLVLAASLAAGCVSLDAAPPAVPAPGSPAGLSTESAPASLSGLVKVGEGSAPGGYNLRVHEGRAYVATFSTQEGVSVFDVSDPTDPVHLGGTAPGTLARSVDVLDYGATVAVATSTGTELEVWNLTDPANPVRLVSLPFGSHNVAVHAEAKVIYNSRNIWDGVGGAMEIVNASDPANIHVDNVWTFPPVAADGSVVRNQGCHDVTVWPDVDRAYCAAYEQTLVLDVSDPLHPVILSAINNPLVTSHHTAFPILDHTVLVIGDEWADNLVWGCLSHPVPGAPQPPAGGLWFYDLTTPKPEVISYLAAPPVTPEPWILTHGINAMCTSHNGEELEEGSGIIAYGWFKAGLFLIDASDPAAPAILDVEDYGGVVGDARWDGEYVYAADDQIGLAVFSVS